MDKHTDINKKFVGHTDRTVNGLNTGTHLQDSKEATWNAKQPIHMQGGEQGGEQAPHVLTGQ